MCSFIDQSIIKNCMHDHYVQYYYSAMCIGGLVGTLPNEQHRISGQLYIVDSKTLFIEDFIYDGGGPG